MLKANQVLDKVFKKQPARKTQKAEDGQFFEKKACIYLQQQGLGKLT